MEMIPTGNTDKKRGTRDLESLVLAEQKFKKKFLGSFLDVAGVSVSLFLIFAVIVITTTDIQICTFEDFAGFTLDFFLLLFCSYTMYVNSADSGTRAGLKTESYKKAIASFAARKQEIIDGKHQEKLPEFCYRFITRELYNTRNAILAIIGFPYSEFERDWLGKTEKEVNASELSEGQKRAVIRANATAPIKLTPEMMMKRGKNGTRREPLGTTPEEKKTTNFIVRFFMTLATAVITSMIVLEAVADPTWAMFVECVVKLLTIVMNGAMGYKFGYENIVIDTVEYMEDQEDLLRQALEYFTEAPKAQE